MDLGELVSVDMIVDEKHDDETISARMKKCWYFQPVIGKKYLHFTVCIEIYG